jgi:hypothetical protein
MTGPIGYDDLRHDTVIQVAKRMAGSRDSRPEIRQATVLSRQSTTSSSP